LGGFFVGRASGRFPHDDASIRRMRALPLEPNDEGAIQRARHRTLETTAPLWSMVPASE
jgi:hypothetical protein